MVQRPTFLEQIEVPADERRLYDVRDFVDRVCVSLGFPGGAAAIIRLAVDEACTNVVKHAYTEAEGGGRVLATAQRGWLEIRVVDQGTAFDGRVDMPQLANLVDQRRKGGLGVFLMHRLMDEVRYDQPAGNEWILRKLRRNPPPVHAAHAIALRGTCGRGPGRGDRGGGHALWVHEGRERSVPTLVTCGPRPSAWRKPPGPCSSTRGTDSRANPLVRSRARPQPRGALASWRWMWSTTTGTIWAARPDLGDLHAVQRTGRPGPAGCRGVRLAREGVEGRAVLHLAVPVRMGDAGALVGAVHLSVRQDGLATTIRAARLRLGPGALAIDPVVLASDCRGAPAHFCGRCSAWWMACAVSTPAARNCRRRSGGNRRHRRRVQRRAGPISRRAGERR